MLLDPQMHELEERIMSDIIRRIRINGEITSSADWQIHRLYELGMSKREIRKIIKETLDLSPADISHMYKQVLRSGYARSRELYKAKGAPWIPFDKNTGLQQLINAVSVQTAGTLQNITQSLGFATRVGGKLAYLPVADYYQKTLDAAMYDIASGAFDYNTVLKRTVREMTNSGLRTIDYASGWANRVEVAARRAIMTGMGQLTSKINEDNAKALETDMFEITWHSGFRPEHWWGGKWYSRNDLVKICGLGSVTGLCGANCYHDYYPVIPGISVPLYTDEQLKAMNEAEQKPVEWNGKTYTKYEATQRQRALETTMRAQRQEMQLLKEGGADEDDLINLRARYRATSQEYARFSEAAGLPQQRERVSIDGLGNIMQGKYTGGSGKESPVRVPPVGAKRGTPVQDAERSELLEHPRMVLTSGAQPGGYYGSGSDDFPPESLDISGESGIIESEEKTSQKLAGVSRGEPMSFKEADSGACNPLKEKGGGFLKNCQASVAAYDARRRGYNVQALAFKGTRAFKQLARAPWSAWIDPSTGHSPQSVFEKSPQNIIELLSALTEHVSSGKRFELAYYVKEQNNGGHVVSVEKDARGLFVYDAQKDKVYRGIRLFRYITTIDYKKSVKMFRVDNAELNFSLLNQVLGGA